MKKSSAHIVAFLILAVGLLFNQVGLNFLHNAHDAHKHLAEGAKEVPSVQEHGDHCKICGLDVLFNLFLETPPSLERHPTPENFLSVAKAEVRLCTLSLAQGRAPPFLRL